MTRLLIKAMNRVHTDASVAGRAFVLTVALLAHVLTGEAVAQTNATVEAQSKNGYGRLILTFPDLPTYQIEANAGVLVISFDGEFSISLDGVDVVLSDYISVGRADPDGKAIRFALTRPIRVNTIEAGDELYVDLLPQNWTGAPPALPPEVIAELARRAEEAERAARDKLLREQMLREASDVTVSFGRLPTFTRVQFNWPVTIKAAVTREDDTVEIQFDRYGRVDLSEINVQPTPHIFSASDELAQDGLLVTLKVGADARLRTFREGQSIIFDISAAEVASPIEIGNAVLPNIATEAGETVLDPADGNLDAVVAPDADDGPALSEGTRSALSAFDEDDISARDFNVDTVDLAVDENRFAADSTLTETSGSGDAAPASNDNAENLRSGSQKAFDQAATVRVKAAMEAGNLKMVFPFPKKTPLAAFSRANVVWVVFDTVIPVDLREVRRAAGGRVADITQTRSAGVTVLRFVMSHASLVAASPLDKEWSITVGDTILEPTKPLKIVRGYREDGERVATIAIKDAGSVHMIGDPIVGDVIAAVTAFGPPRGLVKRQSLVDFTALATAHGVAVVPRSDSVNVELAGERVVVSRDGGGLVLTTGDLKLQGIRREVNGGLFRSNYVDFETWGRQSGNDLSGQIAALELAAATVPEEERDGVRLAAARLLLARGFYTEARGLIRLTAVENEAISRDPTFLALRGVNNVLLGRTREAREDLGDRRLRNSPDTRLWLGLADAVDGKWRDAQVNLSEAESAIGAYPDNLQRKFRFAAVEAALNSNDLASAKYHLEALRDFPLDDEGRGTLEILNGRYSEAMNQSSDAIAAYQAAVATGVRPVIADATWRLVKLQIEKETIPLNEGIDTLENLIAVWRGDDVELQAMDALAVLHVRDSEPRRAFELLQTAVLTHPDNKKTRDFHDHMVSAFTDLYLKGDADKLAPVEALALFYDFRELTPVGRDGDEMIRRLAERLIAVDLLDQAADLLSHQVTNRLKGAARAQVAAQLAMVHLMNRKPAEALRVIQQSRQAVLPGPLQRQRIILEARALAETGRVDLAIERLKSMEGADIDRLRADVLWRGEAWLESAQQIETILGERWSGTAPLTETDRQDVMRAAIGYSLAGDDLGLDRLRRKFTGKMAESPDASAFDVVTAPITEKGAEFRQMVRKIADIDTLEAFIADYRTRYSPPSEDGTEAPESQAQGS